MAQRGKFRLLVVTENAVLAIHVLPEAGTVTIGRGSDNTVQIDDESLSRRHAALHVGATMTIEDLGSSNGTKLREVAIAPNRPHELHVNEPVTLGSLTLLVQGRPPPAQIVDNLEIEHDDLVIAEPAMRDLYASIRRLAASDLPVLILGETGVGKEKLSRAIHQESPRASKPFIAINCAALNDALLESELFGHERGAFTGASTVKTGLLEAACGGTVFLDELGDMSLASQAKLLRVIEEGEVRRVGGIRSIKIGVRFVAATNADLEAATACGRFREDLYFRLSAATLVIPPLRERPREIELLAHRFASDAGVRTTGAPVEIHPDAMALLAGYSWPGNIRELRNVIERAVLLCGEGPITTGHLPSARMQGTTRPPEASADERTRILVALQQASGNQAKAASLLGVSRRTLINRLEQYNLPRPRKNRLRP